MRVSIFLLFGSLLVAQQTRLSTSSVKDVPKCECGVENVASTSRAGKKSPILYPWMSSISDAKTRVHTCGASLISSQHLMTAAHCVASLKPSDVTIVMGVHDLQKTTESERYTVSEFIVHPQFKQDKGTFDNDIAIIKLTEPVSFEPNLLPVCLPSVDMIKFKHKLNALGWGELSPNSPVQAQKLQEVYIKEIQREKCSEIWGFDLGKSRLCAGKEMKNVCKGDDGGVLMYLMDRKWIQVGITSFSGPVCGDKYPGVFTRVSEYLDFIKQNIGDSELCSGSSFRNV